MDSCLSEPAPVRRLGELLEEQQEPFKLSVYLSERGCLKKSLNSVGRIGCCPDNSGKNLKRPSRNGLNKQRKGIPQCSKILRSVLDKLVSANESQKLSNWDSRAYKNGWVSEMGRRTDQVIESHRFSSASSMTVLDSSSESSIEEETTSSEQNRISSSSASSFGAMKACNLRREEAATDRKLQWGCMEDSKILSPVSVLEVQSDEETDQYSHRPSHQQETPSSSSFVMPKIVKEESILSASLSELLIKSLIEKQGCNGVSELQDLIGYGSRYLKTKRVLQQTRQLLFDCVREAVEIHGRNGKRRQYVREFLGPEELGKIICEKICSWGKQSGDVTNITQMINSDFSISIEEWSDFQPQMREIGMEIGDAILEDIRNEIVTDMIDCLH
ncbi:hypothetical protein HHK36_009733 [Tetracentron sinense]|uniref:DUF4378 domain-containing protein n=1 Tax=Tetracentron sinense TaxID=13715 RepID=A0A834ZBF6_TETSI|nr:hypothetical protein HHK36_009733 [Tetracentron sinense]